MLCACVFHCHSLLLYIHFSSLFLPSSFYAYTIAPSTNIFIHINQICIRHSCATCVAGYLSICAGVQLENGFFLGCVHSNRISKSPLLCISEKRFSLAMPKPNSYKLGSFSSLKSENVVFVKLSLKIWCLTI